MFRFWRLLASLEVCLMIMLLICAVMGGGSFLLSGERTAGINAAPLMQWLRNVPFAWSWWLWLTIVLLILLVANTICCTIESIRLRWKRFDMIQLLSPQLIHAGFLLIVLAHGVSAAGGALQQMEVYEGSVVQLPDGRPFGISSITQAVSPTGMPVGFSGNLVPDLANSASFVTISPNHPWISGGYGVYIKHAETFPYRRALLEIHHEPGAGTALAGAILFIVGNLMLLYVKSLKGDPDGPESHA